MTDETKGDGMTLEQAIAIIAAAAYKHDVDGVVDAWEIIKERLAVQSTMRVDIPDALEPDEEENAVGRGYIRGWNEYRAALQHAMRSGVTDEMVTRLCDSFAKQGAPRPFEPMARAALQAAIGNPQP